MQLFEKNEHAKRRLELDSLRGLAAGAVLLNHFLNVFPQVVDAGGGGDLSIRVLRDSPLHVVWAGSEAVLFFFVLSGFVLSLPYYHKPPTYRTFIIRRICRIYVPYLFAVLASLICYSLFSRAEGIPALSSWFNKEWREPITFATVVKHIALVLSFDNGSYDPVLWSLVIEMRISIFFPVLMWLIVRKGFGFVFIASLICYAVGRAAQHYSVKLLNWPNDYFYTLMCLYLFVVGAYLAQNIDYLAKRLQQAGRKYLLVGLGILAYTNAFWLVYLPEGNVVRLVLGSFITTLGVIVFILVASTPDGSARWLTCKPLVFLGKISYSLYLLHAIVLLSALNLLYGRMPTSLILLLAGIVSLAVSTVSYYLVEKPAIAFGRRLTTSPLRVRPAPARVSGAADAHLDRLSL